MIKKIISQNLIRGIIPKNKSTAIFPGNSKLPKTDYFNTACRKVSQRNNNFSGNNQKSNTKKEASVNIDNYSLLMNKQEQQEAVIVYPRPGNAEDHWLKAKSLEKEDQFAEAEYNFREAAKYNPEKYQVLAMQHIKEMEAKYQKLEKLSEEEQLLKNASDAFNVLKNCVTGLIKIENLENRKEAQQIQQHIENLNNLLSTFKNSLSIK